MQLSHDRIIRKSDIPGITGLSARHAERLESEGNFPVRIQLSRRAVGWRLSEIQAWIEERAGARAAQR